MTSTVQAAPTFTAVRAHGPESENFQQFMTSTKPRLFLNIQIGNQGILCMHECYIDIDYRGCPRVGRPLRSRLMILGV